MARGGDVGVKVTGLTKLVRDLQALGLEVDDLKTVFSSIAAQGVSLAKHFAPHRTGKLANSIRGSKSKNRASIRAGGARLPYAGPIHWGWARRNIEPQPFMIEADNALKPHVVPQINAELNRLIKEKGL